MMKKLLKRRDVFYLLAIVYLVAKVYVLSTPSPLDDPLPDHAKDVLMRWAA
jgi:hypothetical protein